MQKLGFEKARYYYSSGTEMQYRGQSSTISETATTTRSYYDEEEQYEEIRLDIRDEAVCLESPNGVGSKYEDPGESLLGPVHWRRYNSVLKHIESFSNELKRFARKPPAPKYRAELALKNLKFITKTDGSWPAVKKRFHDITKRSKTSNGLLHRSDFGECIGLNPTKESGDQNKKKKKENSEEFALALFDVLRRRVNVSGESITKEELELFWTQITDQNFDSRLQIFFDMVDKDADGRLNKDEVRELITLSASANELNKIRNQADEYASLIMETLDPDNYGYIMIENMEILLLQEPMEVMGDGEKKLSKLLSQKLMVTQSGNLVVRFYTRIKYFVLDNWKRIWVMALWIGVMAGLFTWKYIQYKNRAAYQVMGVCVCMAKGAGETLKLNMAIILLPVSRNTITWLRTKTKLNAFVPFNDNLNFHKVIAIAISIGVGIHATFHLACDFPRLIAADEEKYKPMEQYFGVQTKDYSHFLKSVEGVTGIVMVILMTIAFTLATPLKKITGFNAFWYSHHLFVIVYTLLIVHGYYLFLIKQWYKKTTWMYLMVPMALYLCERLIRAFRSGIKAVSILKVTPYQKVLTIQMSKPDNFSYISGQYMYLNCPEVSPLEWHPFSITSAPGDDYLSVHVKDQGDWTKQLNKKFSEVCKPHPPDENRVNRADPRKEYNIPNFPKILIDGPYGAPAQDYKKFEVVLLVGSGIGATPMISIVKDIINNLKGNGKEEQGRSSNLRQSLSHNMVTPPRSLARTKRAYFYWVTREQESFDWFKNVMDEVAITDRDKVIELHNHCTSVYEQGDARSALIAMLQSLNRAKTGVDVVSGTRVMSHFGRPNWKSVFKNIVMKHPYTRVGVFYCGAAGLVKELQTWALDFSHKTSTKFYFHKENF